MPPDPTPPDPAPPAATATTTCPPPLKTHLLPLQSSPARHPTSRRPVPPARSSPLDDVRHGHRFGQRNGRSRVQASITELGRGTPAALAVWRVGSQLRVDSPTP
jgi:hypothetical protein